MVVLKLPVPPSERAEQAIFYNIKNFLTFQLSTALAALSIVAIATCMGFKCPINAMQVRSWTRASWRSCQASVARHGFRISQCCSMNYPTSTCTSVRRWLQQTNRRPT